MTSPSTSEQERRGSSTEGSRATRARERRAIRWGLAVSAVVHVVAVLLYPLVLPDPPPDERTELQEPPDVSQAAIEVIVAREFDDTEPEPPPAPVEPPLLELPEEEPDEVEVPDVLPLPEPVAGEPEERGAADDEEDEEDELRSVAERLRPGPVDPRLWSDLLPDRSGLTDAERANLLLEGMLETFNDSVAVAAALRGRIQDWTFTDEEGRRWGLSPGQLHLGDFSIPLPFQFDRPPGLADDFGRRDWEIADILRGATAAEIRDTWSQRAREIRERMEAERDRRRGNGGG